MSKSFRRIELDIAGFLTIKEIDPKLNDSIKKIVYKFNINSLNQVIMGRVSESSDTKLAFCIDGFLILNSHTNDIPKVDEFI